VTSKSAATIKGAKIVQAWKADGTGSGSFPVVEITNRSVLDQLRDAVLEAGGREPERSPRCEQPAHGQAAWDRSRDHGDEP
jgi:hypothetical protein